MGDGEHAHQMLLSLADSLLTLAKQPLLGLLVKRNRDLAAKMVHDRSRHKRLTFEACGNLRQPAAGWLTRFFMRHPACMERQDIWPTSLKAMLLLDHLFSVWRKRCRMVAATRVEGPNTASSARTDTLVAGYHEKVITDTSCPLGPAEAYGRHPCCPD